MKGVKIQNWGLLMVLIGMWEPTGTVLDTGDIFVIVMGIILVFIGMFSHD